MTCKGAGAGSVVGSSGTAGAARSTNVGAEGGDLLLAGTAGVELLSELDDASGPAESELELCLFCFLRLAGGAPAGFRLARPASLSV